MVLLGSLLHQEISYLRLVRWVNQADFSHSIEKQQLFIPFEESNMKKRREPLSGQFISIGQQQGETVESKPYNAFGKK